MISMTSAHGRGLALLLPTAQGRRLKGIRLFSVLTSLVATRRSTWLARTLRLD
jgi:hypothetical protein